MPSGDPSPTLKTTGCRLNRSAPLHKISIPGVYTSLWPENPLPLVLDSPHSGRDYPADFMHACPRDALKKAEDSFVDELFDCAPAYGAPFLMAHFPRSYIDVNRCETDIDHELLQEDWPAETNPSPRSYAGIGLIRRLVRPGLPVYDRLLSVNEIQSRIETCYRPYHAALQKLLDEAHYAYGQVWHVNCHSMPAQSTFGAPGVSFGRNPDFVLGDRDGTTCSLDFTHAVRDFLKGLGYKVTINDPYKGVELVRRYSSPAEGRHSLQIEICKSIYMDEDKNEKSADFNALKTNIEKLIGFCAHFAQSRLLPLAAD